ncbi:Charged multivesicular body protein 2b [Trichoplax sp. H2]|nr:Charged multivesicular body protein 2b [Trichoplax sp. H2]|eukprot:RDD46744.1 Charged multivesicular body protein 2b [Trichoplax sp. H2]
MFSKKPTLQEQSRQQKRELNRVQRDLARDRNSMERQEKQLEAEIKKMAKLGNKQAATALAKQLLNLRKQKAKSLGVQTKVAAVGYQTQAIQSNMKMASAMSSASKTMTAMNKQLNLKELQATTQNFQRETAKMDMADELLNDTLDSVLDGSGDEEEQDAIVNQVLDEIGIETSGKLSAAPAPGASMPAKASTTGVEDIEEKLRQLRA